MAITIKYLADCKEHIPYLAKIWFEQISQRWVPNASIERARENLLKHANHDKLPLTLVAFVDNKPCGMASLRENDGIQPERKPWLGSLVVDPLFQKQKIGERLIDAVKENAVSLGYDKLYLLAFDPTIPDWYGRLGWQHIGYDQLFGHSVTVMDIALNSKKMTYNIKYEPKPHQQDIEVLSKGISKNAQETVGLQPVTPFAFFIRDENNQIKGGCNGNIGYDWLYVDQLWMDKSLRHQGYGTALMQAAEKLALQNKCKFAAVNTMSWEALDFYKKLGYEVEFERHGIANNSIFYFLRKTLV